jgi:hypothetical protein
MTYSASTVSHFNEIIFRDLYSVCVGIGFPISIKLKVRLKQKKIEAIFFSLYQLINYIEKVGNNKIGFTLTNDEMITRKTFQAVSYFLRVFLSII